MNDEWTTNHTFIMVLNSLRNTTVMNMYSTVCLEKWNENTFPIDKKTLLLNLGQINRVHKLFDSEK